MAYQTGAFSTPDQLLSAIRSFAAANGWTENAYAADGAGNKLHISKATLYLNFRSLVNEFSTANDLWPCLQSTGVACSISTGYLGSSAWNEQPGHVFNGLSKSCSGIFNTGASGVYHLFASISPDMLFCVAETSPGVFAFLGGGMLEKTGSYTGGEWLTGSYALDGNIDTSSGVNNGYFIFNVNPTNHRLSPLPFLPNQANFASSLVRAEFDTNTGFGHLASTGLVINPAWATGGLITCAFDTSYSTLFQYENQIAPWYFKSPAALNGIAPMLPFYLFGRRASDMRSPLGFAPHLRFLNIENYAPGAILTLGSEQWMVFPGYQKAPGTDYTMNYGYAVRYQP